MRRGLGVMAARVLAYHAAPAPRLARAAARARPGAAAFGDLARNRLPLAPSSSCGRRRNSMLAPCPEALKEEEASASYAPPTPPPRPYVPQRDDYAGAGALIPPDDASLPGGHVVLVDGMSMIFRSFYGWKNRAEPLLNSKGEDVSVQYSVAHAILGVLELDPTHLAVCFDAKGKTFRHEMFTDYKANRPPTPPELKETIPRVIEMVRRMGVPLLMTSGVEADDIIGTVARRSVERGLHVSVVSPDKDFFQLLGPRVRQLRPNGRNGDASKGADYDEQASNDGGMTPGTNGFGPHGFKELSTRGLVPYTERDFRAEFGGLDPAQFVDLLAMVGDSSDNIPGVEGIGPKTAPKLLGEYGNIEGCVANATQIRNKRVRESLGSERGAATAHLCRSLVKIRTALSDPTINDPALPIDALGLTGKVPPADGGKGVGEYLERELEIASAADRWREACYAASRRPV